MMKSLMSGIAAVALASAAFAPGSTAHAAQAPAVTGTASALPAACEIGGPHADFKGTRIHMRNRPGGSHVGWADQGDCAYWYQADSGPRVRCPDGSNTLAWHMVRNKRTGVVGYVSGCFLR